MRPRLCGEAWLMGCDKGRKWSPGAGRCVIKSQQHEMYGGQRSSADQITRMMPSMPVYVEPFAGHAYNYQSMLKAGKIGEKAVLGDKNCSAIAWIKGSRKEPTAIKRIVKCQDWRKTVAQTDSKNTLTIFDPPWDDPKKSDYCKNAYKGNCTQFTPQIVEKAKHMKGVVVLLDRDTPEKRKQICRGGVSLQVPHHQGEWQGDDEEEGALGRDSRHKEVITHAS